MGDYGFHVIFTVHLGFGPKRLRLDKDLKYAK